MYKKYGKRIFDIIVSIVCLGVSVPIDLLVLFCIVLESKENPIFVHKRMGKDGKIFDMYKFKSMIHPNGEEKITKVGNIIRKTSIDEFPQFINVLNGDMSIVGPRPFQLSFYDNLDEELASLRLKEKPGLTGLPQIRGRKRLSMKETLELDIEYNESITFLNDLKIFLLTFKALLNMDEDVINFARPIAEEYEDLRYLKLKYENGKKKIVSTKEN